MHSKEKFINRRKFLKTGAVTALTVSVAGKVGSQEKQDETSVKQHTIKNYHPKMKYRRLGNTDIFLSVISMGGLGLERSKALYATQSRRLRSFLRNLSRFQMVQQADRHRFEDASKVLEFTILGLGKKGIGSLGSL